LVLAEGFQIPVLRQAAERCASPCRHNSTLDKNFLNLIMQAQVEIGFEQLIQLVKRLPETQWSKLKQEVDKEKTANKEVSDVEAFLLTAPTFTKNQLDEIAKTRKAINQWRTK